MSVIVDPTTLATAIQSSLTALAAKGASGTTVTLSEACTALATAIAAQVNLHTHDVAYIGGGTASGPLTTEAAPSGT